MAKETTKNEETLEKQIDETTAGQKLEEKARNTRKSKSVKE